MRHHFTKNQIIIRAGKKYQCIVCDEVYACFARFARIDYDHTHTDFNDVFLTLNNAEDIFEYETVPDNFVAEN